MSRERAPLITYFVRCTVHIHIPVYALHDDAMTHSTSLRDTLTLRRILSVMQDLPPRASTHFANRPIERVNSHPVVKSAHLLCPRATCLPAQPGHHQTHASPQTSCWRVTDRHHRHSVANTRCGATIEARVAPRALRPRESGPTRHVSQGGGHRLPRRHARIRMPHLCGNVLSSTTSRASPARGHTAQRLCAWRCWSCGARPGKQDSNGASARRARACGAARSSS